MRASKLPKALIGGDPERQARVVRVAVVCLVFAALFGTALLLDGALRPVPLGLRAHARHVDAEATTRSHLPLPDGKTCRETLFDRSNGDIIESTTAPCDSSASPTIRPRGQHDFVWGRR